MSPAVGPSPWTTLPVASVSSRSRRRQGLPYGRPFGQTLDCATRLEGFATTGEWPQSGNAPLADFGDGPDLPATGTVNIAGPTSRLGESELLSFMPDLLAAANELSVSWPAYRYLKQQDRLAE